MRFSLLLTFLLIFTTFTLGTQPEACKFMEMPALKRGLETGAKTPV